MRNRFSRAVLAVLVLTSAAAVIAQTAPGWLTCPRCQSDEERAATRNKTSGRPFNLRDISGIWGDFGTPLNLHVVPPFTPRGKELYDATRAEQNELGIAASNSKDGMLICDPLGYPRWFTYNYGFQFVVLPDRVLQFFEIGHTWRDIWTDGRKLQEDPPELRWLGYSVGRWEGDEFVIESNGFDDRSWLMEDRRDRRWGFPHTDKLRLVERYRRTSYNTLDFSLTIIDPEVYKKPWTTTGTLQLSPNTELGEYFCVPSETVEYNADSLKPQTGAK